MAAQKKVCINKSCGRNRDQYCISKILPYRCMKRILRSTSRGGISKAKPHFCVAVTKSQRFEGFIFAKNYEKVLRKIDKYRARGYHKHGRIISCRVLL